ncbi:MAG: flagellar basal body P-ring protein FlgI [Armatimonadota bacterium]|jgi:flagellar P-ring protein precursor FlgI
MRQTALIILTILILGTAASAQTVRIKDIATVEGVRANQLVGYGLVVGLEGTGDSQQTKFTTRTLANLLESYGISVPADKLKVKNVASVMVTATLPPFARPGTTIDVSVSSLGDARTLQGGTLLQTPLQAANGEVYAVAQGQVSIGGFSAARGGSSVAKNHATAGRIPGGALVERETKTDLAPQDSINLVFNSNDFTTISRATNAINQKLKGHYCTSTDANSLTVSVPREYQGNVVGLIAELESAELETDTAAKIVINERTGTVVIGGSARISPCAVSHGSLVVEITSVNEVSQPNALATGETVVTQQPTVNVTEQPGHVVALSGANIDELVRALNALSVTPRDLIAILQAIKEAGALHGQLEII